MDILTYRAVEDSVDLGVEMVPTRAEPPPTTPGTATRVQAITTTTTMPHLRLQQQQLHPLQETPTTITVTTTTEVVVNIVNRDNDRTTTGTTIRTIARITTIPVLAPPVSTAASLVIGPTTVPSRRGNKTSELLTIVPRMLLPHLRTPITRPQ